MSALPPVKDRVFVPADPIDWIERRPMTYETFLEFASESQKMEWVDGEVLIYSPPSTKHQSVLVYLLMLFGTFVDRMNAGHLLMLPYLCELWEGGSGREPDILLIAPDNGGNLAEDHFYGAPDLIIEIVSTNTLREDRVQKFREYEKIGVREYWIVDPRRYYQTVDLFVRNERGVFETIPPSVDGHLYSTVLSGFWLDINWLRESPFPRPLLKFAEIMLTVPDTPDDLRAMYQTIFDTL